MANKSPLKMMKKDFYFISVFMRFSLPRYFNVFLDFLFMQKNGLIRKIKLLSKLVSSQPEKRKIAIHVSSLEV